jgi:hypothetical protein
MSYFCVAKTSSIPCLGYGLRQCGYCEWYQAGNEAPHYPLPAIVTLIVIRPWQVEWWQEVYWRQYPEGYWRRMKTVAIDLVE